MCQCQSSSKRRVAQHKHNIMKRKALCYNIWIDVGAVAAGWSAALQEESEMPQASAWQALGPVTIGIACYFPPCHLDQLPKNRLLSYA